MSDRQLQAEEYANRKEETETSEDLEEINYLAIGIKSALSEEVVGEILDKDYIHRDLRTALEEVKEKLSESQDSKDRTAADYLRNVLEGGKGILLRIQTGDNEYLNVKSLSDSVSKLAPYGEIETVDGVNVLKLTFQVIAQQVGGYADI